MYIRFHYKIKKIIFNSFKLWALAISLWPLAFSELTFSLHLFLFLMFFLMALPSLLLIPNPKSQNSTVKSLIPAPYSLNRYLLLSPVNIPEMIPFATNSFLAFSICTWHFNLWNLK